MAFELLGHALGCLGHFHDKKWLNALCALGDSHQELIFKVNEKR
jgi:hypothetical protein